MFAVGTGRSDVISPVSRRLRSTGGGEKRKSERSPSPLARKVRAHRPSGARGMKRRVLSPKKTFLQDPPSPVGRAKRRRVVLNTNSTPGNDAAQELVVRRAARRGVRVGWSHSSTSTHPHQDRELAPLPPSKNPPTKSDFDGYVNIDSNPSSLGVNLGQQSKISSLPQPQAEILPSPNPTSTVNVCQSCHRRFPSYEALEYHKNLKIRALQKCKILAERFSTDQHLAICPIKTCCSSFDRLEDMRQHLMLRHRRAGRAYLSGGERRLDNVYVVMKHSPTEEGIITCPACQTTFNNKNNLMRHQDKSCRGYGQYNCVVCAKHFDHRKQMLNHMKAMHPPPSGVRITGMFAGKQKDRKGERSERSIGGRDLLTQYTFIPEQPIVTSSADFFTPSIIEGVTWLIQRARSSGGNSIIRLNSSSLIKRGESRSLIPFETQAKLLIFSASDSPKKIISRCLHCKQPLINP